MLDTNTVTLLGRISTWIDCGLSLGALIGVVGLWETLQFEYTDGIEAWKNIKATPPLVLELLERKKG
jgi:hypothetical protein